MVIPDINLLIYAYNSSAPDHPKAARWWTETVNSSRPVGVAWPVMQGVLRLLTSRTVLAEPYTCAEVFAIFEGWWEQTNVRLLPPTRETYRIMRELCENTSVAGPATSDAFIAAFALEHRARLSSNDSDFLRYPGLRLENPLRQPE